MESTKSALLLAYQGLADATKNGVEVFDALGVLVGYRTEPVPDIQFSGVIKAAGDEIRIIVDLSPISGEMTMMSVVADGGLTSASTEQGLDDFLSAFRQNCIIEELPYKRSAREGARHMRYAMDMEAMTQLVKKEGHDGAREANPELYEIWQQTTWAKDA